MRSVKHTPVASAHFCVGFPTPLESEAEISLSAVIKEVVVVQQIVGQWRLSENYL